MKKKDFNEAMVSGDITNAASGETTGAVVQIAARPKKRKTPIKRFIEKDKNETSVRSRD